MYTAIFAGVTLVSHILMYINNTLPAYDFPLNTSNVFGTLGFQLLLSGPAEEILFRSDPYYNARASNGKKCKVKWGITLRNNCRLFLVCYCTYEVVFISVCH